MKSILTAALVSLAMATAAYAQSSDNDNTATSGNTVVNGSGSGADNGQTVTPVDPNITNSTTASKGHGNSDPCSDANPVKTENMTQIMTQAQDCQK